MSFHVPDKHRIRSGPYGSSAETHGNNGAFLIAAPRQVALRCIASDGMGWEHVSVSLPERCPTWAEMHFIKTQFWDAEDTVMQLHPPESSYVNCHPYCLHLWRPTDGRPIPLPPSLLVGPRVTVSNEPKEPA